ncbi:hypothetical protein CCHR01_12253 [Colletotrichum chrysophilum]|uniref:Uncharacterized protein n=1 Tax=Colletotrichum chrysophilum TaxID=1836956 RepID=A0AAD9ABN2_9PEZI|nr:hypothetical protein K456DRAFT_224566 [Colletotrichum gloeosporioides 23]KAK1845138.1 hypothetical protein CCHR01_12253 [Colletotrichum chrysophilum]
MDGWMRPRSKQGRAERREPSETTVQPRQGTKYLTTNTECRRRWEEGKARRACAPDGIRWKSVGGAVRAGCNAIEWMRRRGRRATIGPCRNFC